MLTCSSQLSLKSQILVHCWSPGKLQRASHISAFVEHYVLSHLIPRITSIHGNYKMLRTKGSVLSNIQLNPQKKVLEKFEILYKCFHMNHYWEPKTVLKGERNINKNNRQYYNKVQDKSEKHNLK